MFLGDVLIRCLEMDRDLQSHWSGSPDHVTTENLEMFKRWIHTGLLTAALFVGAGMGMSQQEAMALNANSVYTRLEVLGLGDLKEAWEDALSERAAMVSSLKALSTKYKAEVDAIDALKRDGVTNLNRREVERRLRDARALAEQLDSLQLEILRRDELMNQISAQIVGLLDAERVQLEQRLVQGDSSQSLIATLNELSQERERYAQPLPEFDQQRYADVLRDANDVQDPDDMLAMADELLDAEGEVRAQMQELEEQLESLRTRRKLLRRANSFRREERFFEEGDRARTFGTRTRVNSPGARQQPEEQEGRRADEDANGAPEVDTPALNEGVNGPPQEVPSDPIISDDDGTDALGAPESGAGGGEEPSFDQFAGERDHQGGAPDPGLMDNPGTVGVPVESDAPSDPFGTPTDIIVVERQADPNVSVSDTSVPDARIDGQIKSLEEEREKLELKAKELREQASQLKERARQAE